MHIKLLESHSILKVSAALNLIFQQLILIPRTHHKCIWKCGILGDALAEKSASVDQSALIVLNTSC